MQLALSPFERAFNPDRAGSLTGFIGQMMGHPTSAERSAVHAEDVRRQGLAAQRAVSAATAQGLQEFGKLVESGLSPQQAFAKFMSGETGKRLMATPGTDFSAVMKGIVETLTPKPHNIPAGAMGVINPADPNSPRIQAPTTESQTLDHAIRTGLIPHGEITDTTRQLIRPPETRLKAETIKDGERTIGVLYTDPQGVIPPRFITPEIQTAPKVTPAPEASPEGKRTMFRSYGFGASVQRAGSYVGETIDPSTQTAESALMGEQTSYAENLQRAATALSEREGLGVPSQIIKTMQSFLPPPGAGSLPPVQMVQRGLVAYDELSREIAKEKAKLAGVGVSKKERDAATERINMYETVLGAMPSREEMVGELADIRSGKVPGVNLTPSVTAAARSAVTAIDKATGGVASKAAEAVGAPTPPGGKQPAASPAQRYTQDQVAAAIANIPKLSLQQVEAAAGSPVAAQIPAYKNALVTRLQQLRAQQPAPAAQPQPQPKSAPRRAPQVLPPGQE